VSFKQNNHLTNNAETTTKDNQNNPLRNLLFFGLLEDNVEDVEAKTERNAGLFSSRLKFE
jgi:hypothetical protein